MSDEKEYLEDLFQKYREGLLSEGEKEIIARWLVQLDIRGQQLTEEYLSEKQQLSLNALRVSLFPDTIAARPLRIPVWIRAVAAAVLLAISAGTFFHFHKSYPPVPLSYTEVLTHRGETKIVTLEDGTRITLNDQSKIRFPSASTSKTREIFLTGEAFFEVVHNAARPFLVHTDKIKVQVLGTSFDIKAYPEDQRLAVSVTSGKVGVMTTAGGHATYLLTRGDRLYYNKATETALMLKIDPGNMADWQQGFMAFTNEPLPGIITELERHYNTTFQVRNKTLLTREINLKIKNSSLQDVMKALSISADFHYNIGDHKVIIW